MLRLGRRSAAGCLEAAELRQSAERWELIASYVESYVAFRGFDFAGVGECRLSSADRWRTI